MRGAKSRTFEGRRTKRRPHWSMPIWRLLDAPDLLVFVAIAVAGIEPVLRSAVLVEILGGEEVHVRHEARGLVASERPVHLVDHDPALQVERFCDGC